MGKTIIRTYDLNIVFLLSFFTGNSIKCYIDNMHRLVKQGYAYLLSTLTVGIFDFPALCSSPLARGAD